MQEESEESQESEESDKSDESEEQSKKKEGKRRIIRRRHAVIRHKKTHNPTATELDDYSSIFDNKIIKTEEEPVITRSKKQLFYDVDAEDDSSQEESDE